MLVSPSRLREWTPNLKRAKVDRSGLTLPPKGLWIMIPDMGDFLAQVTSTFRERGVKHCPPAARVVPILNARQRLIRLVLRRPEPIDPIPLEGQSCDPRVPLQRSKLENWENAFLGGPRWNHLSGLLGAFNSRPQQGFSIEGAKKMPQKAHLNGSNRELQFGSQKMSFSRFPTFDLCRGTLGSQGQSYSSLFLECPCF